MGNPIKEKIFDLFTLIPLFKSFSSGEIKEKFFGRGLAKIIEYEPGETVITEGKFDNWVYWLIDGKIEVVKNNCRIATFERVGDMVGEMGILEGDARTASVYTMTTTTCLTIDMSILDHPDLERKISKEAFCRDVAQVTRGRLASTTTRLTVAEQGLASTIEKLEGSERRHKETMQTLKKTLLKLDEKDRKIAALEKKLGAAESELVSLRKTAPGIDRHQDKS